MSIALTQIGLLDPAILATARRLQGWREDFTHYFTDGGTDAPETIRGIVLTAAYAIHDAMYQAGNPVAPTALADRMHADLTLLCNLLWLGLTIFEAAVIYEAVRRFAVYHFGPGTDPAWQPR